MEQWLVELNKINHVGFGIATVVIMSGCGLFIALGTELIFKILGIKGKRIEIQH